MASIGSRPELNSEVLAPEIAHPAPSEDVEVVDASVQQFLDDEALALRLSGEVEIVEIVCQGPPSQRSQQVLEDEAFARQLQEESADCVLLDSFSPSGLQHQPTQQELDDEAFAKRLAEQDTDDEATSGRVNADDADHVPSGNTRRAKKMPTRNKGSPPKLLSELESNVGSTRESEKDLSPAVLEEVNVYWDQWLRGEEICLKEKTVHSKAYQLHALHALLQEFPRAPAQLVREAFDSSGSYSGAKHCLENNTDKEKLRSKRGKSRPPPAAMPKVLSREMKLGPDKVRTAAQALRLRQEQHAARIKEFGAVGGLGTCACCFDNELLPEVELRCTGAAGHGFCIPCVKRGAVQFFGSGLFTLNLSENRSSSSSDMDGSSARALDLSCTVLRCMDTSGCDGHFSDVALRKALAVKDYVRYSRRSAALQAVNSGLKDLVPCPSCDFMVEMANLGESVVRCLNPECGKVTCRWCQEDDHSPLRCDEVEKDGEVRIRTFLEEKIAESTLRRCPNPKCRKPWEKTEGCNHMKCPCGTHGCWLCGEAIDKKRPYDHYKDGSKGGGRDATNSRCVVYGIPDWAKKSEEQVRADAEEALKEYLKENPELNEIMQNRKDVLKRTLCHVEKTGEANKSRKKSQAKSPAKKNETRQREDGCSIQ